MFYTSPRRIILTCLCAALAGTLHAADDGVIAINQDVALAGNAIPGDTPGFPVTISKSGSYRLTSNLTVPDADTTAIQINADSVTLDLNGFSILGPVVCTTRPTACPAPGKGIGVSAGGAQAFAPKAVRVTNGSVRGMGGVGIVLGGSGSFVDKVVVYGNAGGGMSVTGGVTGSAATQNGSFGMIATMVRDSSALENVGDGIILDISGGVATGNVSSLNGGFGIYVPFGTATNNTLFLNTSLKISATYPNIVTNNTIINSDASAIQTNKTDCITANNTTHP